MKARIYINSVILNVCFSLIHYLQLGYPLLIQFQTFSHAEESSFFHQNLSIMQVKVFAGLFLLITSVLAGGYAGAIERVWLFYAYQIDGLNPQADQTIGYKCLSWDDKAQKCRTKGNKNGWAMCKGNIGKDKRCSMAKLLNQIG